MKHYLILSEGAYSDYSPIYFVGDREITQSEFNQKGREIGDSVIKEWEALPTRPHVCEEWCFHGAPIPPKLEKYDPLNDNKFAGSYPRGDRWMKLMEEWIVSQGFERIPENISEININYSEFPSNLTLPRN